MNWRSTSVASTLIVALLVVLTLDVTGAPLAHLGPALTAPSNAPVPGVPPSAGGSVCITGAGGSGSVADVLLFAPPLPPSLVSAAVAQAGTAVVDPETADARGVVLAVREDSERSAIGPLAPGALDRVRLELGTDGWVWAGWADHPLTVWQEWRTGGAPGEPRGAVAARCVPSDAPRWTVLGLRTDRGNESLLRIVNPYVADATFAVTLITPDGPVDPIALRNISVPSGARITVRLNDHVPEQSDVAALVTVGAGRVAVEGLQRAVSGVGGVEGVSVVPAVTAPSVTWTMPWVPLGADVDGAIWVLNPEPRTVVVQLTLHTAQGTAVAEGLDSVEVGPGALVHIGSSDLALDGRQVLGVTLRSETTAVFVAAGAQFLAAADAADAAGTGVVRYAASPAADPEWSIAGTSDPQRDTTLHVVNLAETDASLRVTLTTIRTATADGEASADGEGSTDVEASTDAEASEGSVTSVLEPGQLAPGGVARIPLPLEGAGAWSAVVTGGPALVVSRTTLGRELLEPVATDAVASRTWLIPARALSGRSLDGWVARLGTPADLRREARAVGEDDDRLDEPSGAAGRP